MRYIGKTLETDSPIKCVSVAKNSLRFDKQKRNFKNMKINYFFKSSKTVDFKYFYSSRKYFCHSKTIIMSMLHKGNFHKIITKFRLFW